ncbi:hypothetical protein DFQ28_009296 [Apophysomyces sp. BC1034]|nr:hypothetical protein DFQ30_011031 [Apophysomyces sp. BC1015]KAG0169391.1 hypothetical protein DFQ29_009699 [Apophysomyces sp. BC1021]KAG0185451.1 hypothetical protein DFQ28_009296 [Apophysomyces sp. BC1034]
MNPVHWTYGAEGNANLVLRYNGPDVSLKAKILRLRKAVSLAEEETPEFTLAFNETVIAPLLGRDYIVPMTIVRIGPEFLEAIIAAIEPFRPQDRLERPIDSDVRWAFVAPDLTQQWCPATTLTIELKPKWGFLPTSPLIKQTHQKIKSSRCRFCMHTHLKNHQLSQYCPLDLYSLNPARMRRALRALILQPNQQKLRIFLNGHNLPLDELENHDCPLHMLFFQQQPSRLIDHVIDLSLEILLREPILTRLKHIQSRLDELDIEGMFPIYQACNQPDTHDIRFWQDAVQRFQERVQAQPVAGPKMSDSTAEQIQRLYEYVLSMTFKDCSIMLSATPHTDHIASDKLVEVANRQFAYNVKVVDIDLKKMSKIPYWFNLDQRIIEHALQHRIQQRCVE